jgi:hypothetical protein
MIKDLIPLEAVAARYPAARSWRRLQLSTTIALVVLFALTVIIVSIGYAQAETLGVMVEDETGRLALIGLVFAIMALGGITATGMWLTAPGARRFGQSTPR